jgi:hypothetical protein
MSLPIRVQKIRQTYWPTATERLEKRMNPHASLYGVVGTYSAPTSGDYTTSLKFHVRYGCPPPFPRALTLTLQATGEDPYTMLDSLTITGSGVIDWGDGVLVPFSSGSLPLQYQGNTIRIYSIDITTFSYFPDAFQLTDLSVRWAKTTLKTLNVAGSAIASLDLTECSALETLYCNANGMTGLNLTGCVSLTTIIAKNNEFSQSTANTIAGQLLANGKTGGLLNLQPNTPAIVTVAGPTSNNLYTLKSAPKNWSILV